MPELLSRSDNFKSEYSCAVVRVGELVPIEGSDFLAKTLITGTQIIVRKDVVHEGDIMVYAANETQLNEKFLSLNNLYEISCRDMNANADEVNSIMKSYLEQKPKMERLRAEAKSVKGMMDGLNKKAANLNREVKKLKAKLEKLDTDSPERVIIETDIKTKQELADKAYQKSLAKSTVYTGLKQKVAAMVSAGEPIVNEAKKRCGFFNKYGRVRCLTLRGETSFGFLFSIDELKKFCPKMTFAALAEYEGQEFDTVDGELFVKAYVPPIKPEAVKKSRGEKRQKKLKQFDRLVEGQFYFHYDTQEFKKNLHKFNPDTDVTITNKLHGTSVVIGKLRVKNPKKIPIYKIAANKLCSWFGWDKPFIDYEEVYGPVYSSRTVIKNHYINKDVNSGYYNTDLWSFWGDRVYPYLDEGMTIYGEIVGYLPSGDGNTYIQKMYDYGCEPGQSKLMVYRITSKNYSGKTMEWSVDAVHSWTESLMRSMTEKGDTAANDIHPIDIFYKGTLDDLYPHLDVDNHWHENLLAEMKRDKNHFGMEMNEPMCKNEVPREGLCIRINDSDVPQCYKLKTVSFAVREASEVDAGYVDIEVAEGDYYVNNGEDETDENNS